MIGPGAVVTKDVPPNSLAVGVPTKFVKTIGQENYNLAITEDDSTPIMEA
jgi:acetyltransferase-like isoleucine patch superfamily enzyme